MSEEHLYLSNLDAELAHLERVYHLATETQMRDLITEMDREVRSNIIPALVRLFLLAQESDRGAVAMRYFRIADLLGERGATLCAG